MPGPPEGLPLQPYSVFGCWAQTRQRFAALYNTVTARAAENQAQMEAMPSGGTLWICRVVAGEQDPADRYTAFVDRNDPRNADADGIEPDMPDYAAGDPWWTVFGIAVPPGKTGSEVLYTGERYGDYVAATSAGAAEDVAIDRLAEKGGELWVCTVLPGRVIAADTYATHVDPDVRPVG